jgi:hypothetical protein
MYSRHDLLLAIYLKLDFFLQGILDFGSAIAASAGLIVIGGKGRAVASRIFSDVDTPELRVLHFLQNFVLFSWSGDKKVK